MDLLHLMNTTHPLIISSLMHQCKLASFSYDSSSAHGEHIMEDSLGCKGSTKDKYVHLEISEGCCDYKIEQC